MAILLFSLAGLILLSYLFVWYTRRVWFFRDPDHGKSEQDENTILSPVYGIVAYTRRITNGVVESEKKGEKILISDITKDDWPSNCPGGDGWLIGIAMTALDVHYQYASIPGRLVKVTHHQHGRNLPMFDIWEYIQITWFRRWVQLFAKKYVFDNERQTMWIQGKQNKVALVLIADKFVSKITSHKTEGAELTAGEKISFIGRGSQVDVVVCGMPDLRIWVQPGDAVKGPQTILARKL